MNIICNNCAGAHFYSLNGEMFTNPFTWSIVNLDDFLTLMEHYDEINFKQVEFGLETFKGNDNLNSYALVDNKVTIHYIHYLKTDEEKKINNENGTSITSPKILEYTKNKYFERYNRGKNEAPIFMFFFRRQFDNYEILFNKVCEVAKKYERYTIVCADNKLLKDGKTNKFVQLINLPNNYEEIDTLKQVEILNNEIKKSVTCFYIRDSLFTGSIICNTCVGARIYENTNRGFNNPFIWNIIKPSDFIYLSKNYGNINFQNIKQIYDKINNMYGLRIDDKVNVYYPHYKYDKKYKNPTKIGIDVYYCDIQTYIKTKYLNRLKRMHEKPLFILDYDNNYGSVYTPNDVKIFKENTYSNVIVASKVHHEFGSLIDVEYNDKIHLSSGEKAKQIIQYYDK